MTYCSTSESSWRRGIPRNTGRYRVRCAPSSPRSVRERAEPGESTSDVASAGPSAPDETHRQDPVRGVPTDDGHRIREITEDWIREITENRIQGDARDDT